MSLDTALHACPQCQSTYTYQDADLLICPECAYEWREGEALEAISDVIKDANGNALNDASDGHDIDCKIDGIGAMKLKSEFVKKA